MAQSNGVPTAPPRGNKKHLRDDDLFVCTLNGETHHVRWSDIETLAIRPPSLWHIKDVSGGTCTALNVDQVLDVQGNRLSGSVPEYVVNPGEERVIVGNDVRFTDSTGNWNFGEQTRTEYQFEFDRLLSGCHNFNGDIQNLDVTEFAFNTSYMFNHCYKFSQPVTHFRTTNVNTLRAMFQQCFEFNQPVNHFDTSNCENFMLIFQGDQANKTQCKFNQPLDKWDTSRGKDFNSIFRMSAFNQDISGWDMSSAVGIRRMFTQTTFNQDISSWNVSNVKDFLELFYLATAFNQPIGGWNTKSAVDMDSIFYEASAFNQNINQWCVRTASHRWWDHYCPIAPNNSPVWGTCPRGEG